MTTAEQMAQQEVDTLCHERNELDDMVKAKIQDSIVPLQWDHYPADGAKPERWMSKMGVVELLESGRYAAGFDARYDSLEDATAHYQRRYIAKVMKEHFGVRIEP